MSADKTPTVHEHDEIAAPVPRNENEHKALSNDAEVCSMVFY